MTPLPPREWHPRRQDGESVRALLERKLVIEQRHLEDLTLACAPSIMRDHQSGRVVMLKELIAQLSEQQLVLAGQIMEISNATGIPPEEVFAAAKAKARSKPGAD